MNLPAIIGIILFVVLVVLILKFVKNIVKAIFSIVGLIIIFLIIGGSSLYLDISGFKENFGKTPNLYLLEKDGQIIAGASGFFLKDKEPSFAGKDELELYRQKFSENNLEAIKGDNYKLFIIKSGVFDSIGQVKTDDETISKQKIFELLESETPVNDYLKYKGISIDQRDYLLDQLKIKDSAQFKGLLLALLFKASIEENSSVFIFSQYKQGNIVIYPESALFKLLKLAPSSALAKYLKIEKGE
jgi:hypothetical protein